MGWCGNDRSRSIEQINRHAMAIEGVAGQHHHVRAGRARRAQDAGEPGGTITPMQPCSIVMIYVQVGAVNDHDVLGEGAGMRHGGRT